MLLPLQQANSSLGLDEWLKGAGSPLAIAAHPSGVLLALARGQVLTVLPLLGDHSSSSSSASQQQHSDDDQLPDHHHQPSSQHQQQQQQAAQVTHPIHSSKHEYTALGWFGQLQGRRQSAAGQQQQPQHQQQRQRQPQQQQQQQPGQPRCSAQTYQSLLESEVLLSGTADGHLQIHNAAGQLLYKQRLFGSAVMDILVRPHCSGLSSADAGEEVCVCFATALVRINSLDLRAQVRMLQLMQAGGASIAVGVTPLPYVRYDLPAAVGPRSSGLSFGPLPAELYSLLASGVGGATLSSMAGFSSSSKTTKHKVSIVTVGRSPCMAAFEAEDHPSRSTLSALVGMASSLTSGVVGAASKVAGLGPSVISYGVKSLVKPLSSWYSSSGSTAQGATGSSTSSSTTTNQPIISFDDLQQLPKPDPLNLTKQLRDDDRVLEALVPAPVGALLVAPDNLGRVLLMDGAGMVAVRIWKGYRDAQCGWVLPPSTHPAASLGLLLVLYAPKRQVLEVWLPRSGQRLVALPVDYPCLLVSVGLPCGGWGNPEAWTAWMQQCGSATTLVVNMQTGHTWDALDCLLEEE